MNGDYINKLGMFEKSITLHNESMHVIINHAPMVIHLHTMLDGLGLLGIHHRRARGGHQQQN